MKKKTAQASFRKDKSELIIVILASACVLLILALGLIYQQKEQLNMQNSDLEQQYFQQNMQIQSLQDKVRTMEVSPTPAQ